MSSTGKRVREEALYADFMEQVGMRMLQVDAWEHKQAWQRLQNDLLLRRECSDLLKALAAKDHDIDTSSIGTGGTDFDLSELYLHEDIDAAAHRRERAASVRSMEDRLVDRVQAAFSLAPDMPRSYNGVQVPFTLEEFRDYVIGYSQSEHFGFVREQMLGDIRGKRRKRSDLDGAVAAPRHRQDDYILWATKKYAKYSRKSRPFKDEKTNYSSNNNTGSNDESGEEDYLNLSDHGDNLESNEDPNRFKMYPSALYNIAGRRVDDLSGYDERAISMLKGEKSSCGSVGEMHADRMANDPHYLSARCDRPVVN
jgi:hypothetical protein